ncbi:MAG: hypothetical protein ACXWIE_21355 [Burkholderiales bacterium]
MKRRKPLRRKSTPPGPGAQEDLNATSGALYEVAGARESGAAAQDNEPVEDPLEDWPETSGEEDQWVKERRARDEEREG